MCSYQLQGEASVPLVIERPTSALVSKLFALKNIQVSLEYCVEML